MTVMNLRFWLLWLSIGLASGLATAQRPSQGATVRKPASKVCLWEVRSETATVYLLGSVHVASKAMYPLDARIERAFASAGTLVLETPASPAAQAEAGKLLQQAGLYTPPDSLDKHLDDATRERLTHAARRLGLPVEAIHAMKPWFASVTLTLLGLNSIGFSPELGIDLHFHNAAGKRRVVALETVQEQIALFRDMAEPTQLAALRQTLEQLPDLESVMKRTIDAWQRGDTKSLEALLIEPTRGQFPELYKRLLADRNARMAEKIDGYLKGRDTTFVVVGSGHLVGKDSIVSLLAARGHAPKQL
jgi:uncharacterized protein